MKKPLADLNDAGTLRFPISWRGTMTVSSSVRGSLDCPADLQRIQLLDQFAVWINEGGAGSEPKR